MSAVSDRKPRPALLRRMRCVAGPASATTAGSSTSLRRASAAAAARQSPETRLPSRGSARGPERRQLTVMFCDLVGSTALSHRLDPEDLREVIRSYQESLSQVIARYEGYVARYMGDGFLAYFGYPRAHEDDAARAIRAGLEIDRDAGSIGRGKDRKRGARLRVRIGIATGLVVVGDLVREGALEEDAVMGETPNVAARLQTLAKPNSVVVRRRPATWRGVFSSTPIRACTS